ncbi:MAG: glycosyltransferase [Flavobacteriales bacterium]
MKILYISYWSLSDPLTPAAIYPYFPLLQQKGAHITFYTFEVSRDKVKQAPFDFPYVEHRPIFPRSPGIGGLSKIELVLRGRRALIREARRGGYDLVLAKAAMAGAMAHMVHTATGLPYVVESFEPHSEYMVECGVWRRSGLRFRFAAHYERLQVMHAKRIITVTHNHRNDLIAEGVDPSRVSVIPSITDLERFAFNPDDRARVRSALGIDTHAITGIYVGKFGGLYYDQEAFDLFKRTMDRFSGMRLIILSPMDKEWIVGRARQAGIPLDLLHVTSARHDDVPAYLSASDIAFSPIKPAPVKLYQCPVKNGEYWANGLPMLMTDLVADDYRLLRQGIGGSVFGNDLVGLEGALDTLEKILSDPAHRVAIAGLARKYKSLDLAREVYATLF